MEKILWKQAIQTVNQQSLLVHTLAEFLVLNNTPGVFGAVSASNLNAIVK
ncbi:hypothetical protein [Olivibacter sp. XZL3]|nr:hypothetical protein [Olivibacter sp. XZL3]